MATPPERKPDPETEDRAGIARRVGQAVLRMLGGLASPRPAHALSLVLFLLAAAAHLASLSQAGLDFRFEPGAWPRDVASGLILAFATAMTLAHMVTMRGSEPSRASRAVLAVAGTFWIGVGAIQLVRLGVGADQFKMVVLGVDWGTVPTLVETIVVLLCAGWCTAVSYVSVPRSSEWSFPKLDDDPLVAAISGLTLAFFLAFPAAAVYGALGALLVATELLKEQEVWMFAWVGIIGAQGAIVSVLVRLRALRDEAEKDGGGPNLLFLNCLFKPFVGMTFAQLSYCVALSGMLGLSTNGDDEKHAKLAFIVLAFAAGFSERFAGDLVGRIQVPGGLRSRLDKPGEAD